MSVDEPYTQSSVDNQRGQTSFENFYQNMVNRDKVAKIVNKATNNT